MIRRTNENFDHSNDVGLTSTSNTAQLEADDISLAELWRVVLQRRWIIVACALGCLALAAAYCVVVKPRYRATARIAIDPDKMDSLNLEDLGISMPGGADAQTKLETEVQILQSDSLALEVIGKLKLQDSPLFFSKKGNINVQDPATRTALLSAWHSGISVKSIPKTNLIEISFRSKSQEISANAVNTLLGAYVERNFRVKYESTMQASDWLSKQIEDIKSKTQQAEQKLADYQTKSGILFWGKDNANSVVTDRLTDLNKALTDAQADRILKESRYRVALSGSPDAIADIVSQSPLLVLKAQQLDLNNQYTQATAKYGTSYPRVRQLKAQIDQTDASIKTEIRNVTERLKQEYASARHTEAALQRQMDAQTGEAYKLNQGAVQMQILQREAMSNRDLYEGLLKKLKEAGVAAGLKSTNVNVVDYAQLPSRPSDPKVPLILGAGLLGGVFLGIVCAFVVENMDDSVSGIDEAELYAGMPSLAIIPQFSIREAGRLLKTHDEHTSLSSFDQIALTQPKSHAAEAFRSLRTALMLSRSSVPPKTIVVTSPFAGEGKSTASLNLGIVLAQRGARVLLVDADMRRSSLHRKLALNLQPGLSGVLTGSVRFEDSVVTLAQLPTLSFLPGGLQPPNPAELLGSQTMKDLIQRCSDTFEFVIFDTPPALTVTDPVILAAEAEATVLVVRAGQTGKMALRHARNVLFRSGAKLTGFVLNGIDTRSAGYYYYGYGNWKYAKYYRDYYENDNNHDQ